MSGTLSVDHRKWAETIESCGGECLCSPVSAANVEHVLSHATIRAPQKQLCSAVSDFVPGMLNCASGISILTSLVCHGTIATVDALSGMMLSSPLSSVWSLESAPKEELTKCLSHLFERLMYREDCTGQSFKQIVNFLVKAPKSRVFSASFSLPAAARLMRWNAEFATAVSNDRDAQKSLAAACSSGGTAAAAERCCQILLEKGGNAEDCSDFLWKAVSPMLKAKAKVHPRESILASLASGGPVHRVSQLGNALLQWPNLHALCKRESYMDIIASIMERADDEAMCTKLISLIFLEVSDIDDRLGSRKSAANRMLASLTAKPAYLKALEKQMGGSQTKKLVAAKVRHTKATMPQSSATQKAIQERLQRLNSGNLSVPSVKRPRLS